MENPIHLPTDPVHRLFRLTDIIFALSMVMFVLSGTLTVADTGFWSGYDEDPSGFVLQQGRELLTALLVFLFIAVYWATHVNQAKYIIRVNGPYIWINLFYLFFIAMAPLPNALSIKFGSNFFVQMFVNLNMFLIGLFGFLAWYYATKGHRLVDKDLSVIQIRTTNGEMIVEPLVAVIAGVISFTVPSLWELSLLLLPVGMVILGIVNRKKAQAAA